MAIGYARVEFVKRSEGKNSCAKAAYNSRSRIEFQGNCIQSPDIYDWSSKERPSYHEILLPIGANEQFKSPQILWNAAESKENKCNSQVAIELLLALPDDKIISLQDRIELAKTFIQLHFIDKGLAAQIDIHSPEKRIKITRNHREIGVYQGMLGNIISEQDNLLTVQFDSKRTISFNPQEFTGFIETENNWHAHVLISTRRFHNDGLDFDAKARDLMPRICNGKVVSGDDWGKLWTDHQNHFFQQKGFDLRVDATGIEPQEHLGPVRMRGRAFDLLEEHSRVLEMNAEKIQDPSLVLAKITERQSVFTERDVERFIQKHLSPHLHSSFKENFWKQTAVVPLINKQTGEVTGKYSTQIVIEEETTILRLADKIRSKKSLEIDLKNSEIFAKSLNNEQKSAFNSLLQGKKLGCLQGYAGTGKSYLLAALKTAYSHSGYTVRAFGPDNATSDVLKEKGFENAENIYRFLYGFHNSKRHVIKDKEVWILDEAGKLGNQPLLQFLKAAYTQGAQVILSGDYAQLSSVERGGLFRLFCEKYNAPILQDIQRQKTESQRQISKSIATGEIGSALDKLSAASSIKWSLTKNEAIEALISQWSIDTRANRKASTLLLAHSNDEVRVLNEMVRIIKKQRGELSDKEFACDTALGKIYLSIGDQIEFRQKNKELGVTNGLYGTLIEANPQKFVVAIESDKQKKRTVIFNPQEYSSYQLGYASTNYRSQGKTIDKAYVLHSSALNKRLFYVGLTRHSHEAYYFVSKDQAYCLSDLKRQANRESVKENTLVFTTPQEIEQIRRNAQEIHEIQALKHSDSFVDQIKGYGLATYALIKAKTSEFLEYRKDKAPSEEFFNPPAAAVSVNAEVKEVSTETDLQAILKSSLAQESPRAIIQTTSPTQRFSPEHILAKAQAVNRDQWVSMETGKKQALQSYFSSASHASTLGSILELEIESSDHASLSSSRQKEWEISCGQRNAAAHNLVKTISRDELTLFLRKKYVKPIFDQADRYQNFIDRSQKIESASLETELKSNIEPLLCKLFPNGPHQTKRKEFRFGNKGSLSVDKSGQFFDFERQEGGGILKLVQRELGLGRLEAIDWAKRFLGMASDIKVPEAFARGPRVVTKDSDWVSLKPDPKVPAPSFENIGNKKLHYYFNEVARHSYCDENGQLLYYRLRLIDKTDVSKKMTPPLSFGYWKSNPQHLCWALKGYDSDKAALYNLAALKKNPLATVLLVEGEKTADQALNRFSNESFICLTWPGGAGAVRRADWTSLSGRNVIIWPDNDHSGFKAAEQICSELRKIGVQSLKVIPSIDLQNHFPEKWDLADPVPSNLSPEFLQKLLFSAQDKAIDPNQVIHRTSSIYRINNLEDKARVNEILWRVDFRLRSELERQNGGQYWKVNESILTETARILLKQNQLHKSYATNLSKSEEFIRRLSWQSIIYEAAHGKPPSDCEIDKIQDTLQKFPALMQESQLAVDNVLTFAYERSLNGQTITAKEIQEQINLATKFIQNQSIKDEFIDKSKILEKDISK